MTQREERIIALEERLKREKQRQKEINARNRTLARNKIKADQEKLERLFGKMIIDGLQRQTWSITKLETAMTNFLTNEADLLFFKQMTAQYHATPLAAPVTEVSTPSEPVTSNPPTTLL